MRLFLTTTASFLFALSVAGPAAAKNLTVIAANLPPMMDEKGQGREADILREAFECAGHTIQFKVEPFTRHWETFKSGEGDVVTTVPIGMDFPGAVVSRHYIAYQNGASVLSAGGLSVKSLGDLAGKSAITFIGGREILPGLKEAKLADVREQADQLIHSNLLFAKRVDAVLGDGLIFAEYNRQLVERAKSGASLQFDPAQPVTFTAIFPPNRFGAGFRDASLKAGFDECIGKMEASGRIQAINKTYIDKYRDTVGNQYVAY